MSCKKRKRKQLSRRRSRVRLVWSDDLKIKWLMSWDLKNKAYQCRWTQKIRVTYNSCECVFVFFMWKVDSVHKKQRMCVGLISGTSLRGPLHGGLNLSFSSNTLPAIHSPHTQRKITSTPTVSFTPREAWKKEFASFSILVASEYESQWLRLQWWLTQIKWPLIYSCCRSSSVCVVLMYSFLQHRHPPASGWHILSTDTKTWLWKLDLTFSLL